MLSCILIKQILYIKTQYNKAVNKLYSNIVENTTDFNQTKILNYKSSQELNYKYKLVYYSNETNKFSNNKYLNINNSREQVIIEKKKIQK